MFEKIKNIAKTPEELSWLQRMLLDSIPKFQRVLGKRLSERDSPKVPIEGKVQLVDFVQVAYLKE